MERNRRPPDVEEALSSMLWTPYQRTSTDSSEDDETDTKTEHKENSKSKMATNDLYATADRHLYPQPIQYQPNFVSNYGHFFAKSYNSSNRQLPSYDHIEKERTYHSLTNGCDDRTGGGPSNSNGIYLIPPYSKCSSNMVHSFTDDFIQYQVNCVNNK